MKRLNRKMNESSRYNDTALQKLMALVEQYGKTCWTMGFTEGQDGDSKYAEKKSKQLLDDIKEHATPYMAYTAFDGKEEFDESVNESRKLFKASKGKALKFKEDHAKGEHLYSIVIKTEEGWEASFQVNAMNDKEAEEKARTHMKDGEEILHIYDVGEYKAFDADEYAGFDESADGGWFDEKYGFLQKDIPEECVVDCSGPGRKDDAVAYWVDELKFYIPQPLIEKAKNYLREFGAWEEDELDQWAETEDIEHQLAQHVLWCFCCDLAEGNVEPGELYLGH